MGAITASSTTLKPDAKYKSVLASKFINCLMHSGKKSIAQAVFYGALDQIKKKLPDKEEIEVFLQAVSISVDIRASVKTRIGFSSMTISAPCARARCKAQTKNTFLIRLATIMLDDKLAAKWGK